jgi:hypothetical protein
MAKKAIVPTHSIWNLISDDSRRALVAIHMANAEFEKAQRQLNKVAKTPIQATGDRLLFNL